MKKLIFAFLFILIIGESKAQITGLEILGDKDKINVPFEYKQGFILIRIVFANSLPLTFLFDTGAEHTLLFKRELSDILGIPYSRRVPILGADLSKELYALIARRIPLEIPNGIVVRRDIMVLEENVYKIEQIAGIQIDGILGGSFFKELVVNIDYKRERLTLCKPKKFKPPTKNVITFDIEIKRAKPYLTTEVQLLDSSFHEVKLLIDTGAAIPFLLHSNTSPYLKMPDRIITGNLGMGLGGIIKGYLGKVNSLKMKEFAFMNLLTSFQDLDLELYSDKSLLRNGILGNKILERFKVTLDYHRSKVYLIPYKSTFNKKFKFDKSGLILIAVGHDLEDYFVKEVIPNSPADEAGFQKGDKIIRVGLLSSKWYTLETIINKLRGKTGRKLNIKILRDGIKMKKNLVLRDFFDS